QAPRRGPHPGRPPAGWTLALVAVKAVAVAAAVVAVAVMDARRARALPPVGLTAHAMPAGRPLQNLDARARLRKTAPALPSRCTSMPGPGPAPPAASAPEAPDT